MEATFIDTTGDRLLKHVCCDLEATHGIKCSSIKDGQLMTVCNKLNEVNHFYADKVNTVCNRYFTDK